MAPPIVVQTATAVGYFRVSSPGQAGERHVSLEVQQSAFTDYCLANHLDPVATFTDVASGRKDDRPHYRAMLAYVAEHGVGNVVVLFLDRFGRNPREILRRFWGLQEQGTEVRSIKEDLREEMLLLVRAGIAGAESKRTGERVKEALEKAAGRGRYVAKLPFGYVKVYDQLGQSAGRNRPVASGVEQVPAEAAVVRLAFVLATVQNKGYKAIADELNRRGYRTRAKSLWAAQSIKLLLTNPAMAGWMVWAGEVISETAYPPILTNDEWKTLQQRLTIRREGQHRGRTDSSPYLLSGVLRCGHCQGAMSGASNGKHRYYVCCNHKMAAALCEQGSPHRQEALEEAILDHLGRYSDPEVVRQLLEAQGQEIDHRAVQELARVDKRLGELERAFLNDLDRVDREIMTESEYLKRQEIRRQEQGELQARKEDLEAAVAAQNGLEAAVTAVPVKVRSFIEDFGEMDVREAKAMLQTIIKSVHVSNDGRIEIEFR